MKIKILIADDHAENLYLLDRLLLGSGYEVISADNGKQALEKAIANPPDLIISDILMPVMDGFTLLRKWKADIRLKDIPFVFYTATYTDAKDEELALHLGVDMFIVKPQDPDSFLLLIKELLENLQKGKFPPLEEPKIEEEIQLREYNQALIRKLEDKMTQADETNRQLSDVLYRYKTLLLTLPDAIFVLNDQGFIMETNDRAVSMFGYTRDELLQLELKVLHATSDTEKVMQFLKSAKAGKIEHGDCQLKRKDGNAFYGNINAAYLPLIGFQVVIRDISERKLAEEQLSKSFEREQLLGNIVREAPMAIAYGYPDGRIESCNEAFLTLTGYTLDELKHVKWNDTLTPEKWRAIEYEKLNTLSKKTITVTYEKEYIRKDGSIVPVELAVNARYDNNNTAQYYIGFVTNISERKQAEKDLLEKLKELQLFHKVTVGRELAMIELKKEVNELLSKSGQAAKYKITE